MAKGVVTRVLMRYRRDKCFREERSGRLIRKRSPIVPAIPSHSVAQLRIRPQSHALPGQHSSPNERRIVHAILQRQRVFFPGGERWKLRIGAHRRKIGNDPEHSLGLLAFGTFWLWLDGDSVRCRSNHSRLRAGHGSHVQRCRISSTSRLLRRLLGRTSALLVWSCRLRPRKRWRENEK